MTDKHNTLIPELYDAARLSDDALLWVVAGILIKTGADKGDPDLVERMALIFAEFEKRMPEDQADIAAITKRGHDDGKAAASWLIDGNTDDPEAVLHRLIYGIDEGDPEILDDLPMPHLGGEFSDNPTWEDICKEELDRYGDDGEEDLLNVYHHAFHEGVEAEIRRMYDGYKVVEPRD